MQDDLHELSLSSAVPNGVAGEKQPNPHANRAVELQIVDYLCITAQENGVNFITGALRTNPAARPDPASRPEIDTKRGPENRAPRQG
ncbi:MAG: hypothetical protein ABJN75_03735 [Hoeflea sp.]|uniref:hypothetical protein n=1 Tax=Hoeflea sp. TaxID=1940281 RepID=UPI003296CEDF